MTNRLYKLIELYAQVQTQEPENPEQDERKYPGITTKRVSAITFLQVLYRESPYYKEQINKVLNNLIKKNDENYNRYNLAKDGLVLSLPDLDGVMGAMISCWQESIAINRMGQLMKALADYPDTYDPIAAAKRLREGARRGNISMQDALASRKDILKAMAMKGKFAPKDFDKSEIPELEMIDVDEESPKEDAGNPEFQKNVDYIMDFVSNTNK